jgi:hypothetical protein
MAQHNATQLFVLCAGCVGTSECGVTLDARLPRVVDEATLRYKFKFSAGYEWVKGGKLPGLCDEGACLKEHVSGALLRALLIHLPVAR